MTLEDQKRAVLTKSGFIVISSFEEIPDSDEFTQKMSDITQAETNLFGTHKKERLDFYWNNGFKDYMKETQKVPSRDMIADRAKANPQFRSSYLLLTGRHNGEVADLRHAKEKAIRLETERKSKQFGNRFEGLSPEEARDKRRQEINESARKRYQSEEAKADRRRRNSFHYFHNGGIKIDRDGNPRLNEEGEAIGGIKEVQKRRYTEDEEARQTQIDRVKQNQLKKKEQDPHYGDRIAAEARETRRWNKLSDDERTTCPDGCKGVKKLHMKAFREAWTPPKESSISKWSGFKVIKILNYEKYYNGDPIEECYS